MCRLASRRLPPIILSGFVNAPASRLNDLCIHNPEATYFVRAAGDSMTGDCVEPGDILVVDSSYDAVDGRIVVVCLNGDNIVKRVHFTGDLIVLMSSNTKYDPIYVHPGENFRVFGVVTFVIQKTR